MPPAAFFIKYKLHHILFWLLLLGTWYLLRFEDYASPKLAFVVTLIKVVDLVFLVYITNYILIPRLLYKKKYFLFGLLLVLMITGSSILKMNILGRLTQNPLLLNLAANWKDRLYDNVIPHFFLVIAGAAIKLLFDQITLQRKIAEMAKEKAEAELNFLKSQINPHFLFNSLNSVYFLIDKSNEQARQVLHKFSEMLRYQLYEANGEKIPIEKEIAYLRDYVDLQKLRNEETCPVEFYCGPEVKEFTIEPLLLIPFVENAFKHTSQLPGQMNFIKLSMTQNNGYFRFTLENSKENIRPVSSPQGGIGLHNVKRRLELLYPQRHKLLIDELPDRYKADLILKI